MGRVTLYIAASVDGFIATEDGGVAWLEEYNAETDGDDEPGSYDEFFAGVDCLLMGSKTYEQVLGFGEWPYGQKPTYVVTGRELPLATDAVALVDGDVDACARRLEQQYEHVWLVGGAQLARELLRLRHVDEIRLSLVPVLLGSGIPLFDDAGETHDLALVEATTYRSGIVEVQYRLTRRSGFPG